MQEFPFTVEDLHAIALWDTPTICNALEAISPERRHVGFTTRGMICARPEMPMVVGLARTSIFRTREAARNGSIDLPDYLDYLSAQGFPTVALAEDLDDQPGYGAYVGEISVAIHKALGAVGYVTNGALRDMKAMEDGFQVIASHAAPSHAHFHVLGFGGEVNIFGMQAAHNDVICVDYHGAVVVPRDAVKKLPETIQKVVDNERHVLELVRRPGFTPQVLRDKHRKAVTE
ncbi:hypothetical protein [Caballeronia sp. DA-9]|uniref:RraA family protein n=1 Tax=Caballeronia sp. DA-9 TaxID=3436237 RepID=UPI003F677FED